MTDYFDDWFSENERDEIKRILGVPLMREFLSHLDSHINDVRDGLEHVDYDTEDGIALARKIRGEVAGMRRLMEILKGASNG